MAKFKKKQSTFVTKAVPSAATQPETTDQKPGSQDPKVTDTAKVEDSEMTEEF